ncbi:MAG TPA: asparagine synthase-related protein, partial [Thermoleophilaceae bacterium]|nr:asparagine synthase-related protein [Thermoleophilaceae bacterium]
VPLLDHRLVEFAAALPSNLKLRRLTRKYLLRRVARKLLPHEVIERPKQGFPMPLSHWFRGEANEFLRDHLSPATLKARGLFDAGYVDRLLREHESGHADHASLLYGLLSVELWQRLYLDRAATPAQTAAS